MGRDRAVSSARVAWLVFQSTRPHGARRWDGPGAGPRRCCFNPRARMGRDGGHRRQDHHRRRFNPRARMGRDDVQGMSFGEVVAFQSTRPHGARQVDIAAKTITVAVSIHAPAWGATGHDYACCVGDRVSIHAPAWGATRPAHRAAPAPRSFNPRARMGRDATLPTFRGRCLRFQSTRPHGARLGIRGRLSGKSIVSIHAPAWGATVQA